MMFGKFNVVLLGIILWSGDAGGRREGGSRRKNNNRIKQPSNNECAIFSANASYAMNVEETFIDIGHHYTIGDDVVIHFEVFPDRYCHDGVLFSVGTEKFEYYEWKTKAVKTQFFVIEFYFSALSMLMKALDTYHMIPLEIFRTYPDAYFLANAEWHEIRASRRNGTWTLSLDDIVRGQLVTGQNNVQLRDHPVYIGGKPGQYHYQFRGIIKNLNVNGEKIMMRGKARQGLVHVYDCDRDPEVNAFISEIRNQREPSDILPRHPTEE